MSSIKDRYSTLSKDEVDKRIAEARADERRRHYTIMSSSAAIGRTNLAIGFVVNTDVPADEVTSLLEDMPIEDSCLSEIDLVMISSRGIGH